MQLDISIVDLLADKSPSAARDLILAWSERRNSSWANAAREADARAASPGHLPQIRGQLRYHLGEAALGEAARSANVGAMPLKTTPPGGIFIVARVGKFALVSVTSAHAGLMPRRSVTRKLLSQPNENIDPQTDIFADDRAKPNVVTELAYFGCLVAIPNKRDPSVPAELAFGVPTANLGGWISWIPLPRLHVMLQQKVDAGGARPSQAGTIPDAAFPKFRMPKRDQDAGDESK